MITATLALGLILIEARTVVGGRETDPMVSYRTAFGCLEWKTVCNQVVQEGILGGRMYRHKLGAKCLAVCPGMRKTQATIDCDVAVTTESSS